MTHRYRDLTPDEVRIKITSQVATTAERARLMLADELRLRSLQLVWIGLAASGEKSQFDSGYEIGGYVLPRLPDTVRVVLGADIHQMVGTVSHEARHLWQFRVGGFDRFQAEFDSGSFELDFTSRFFGREVSFNSARADAVRALPGLIDDLASVRKQFAL